MIDLPLVILLNFCWKLDKIPELFSILWLTYDKNTGPTPCNFVQCFVQLFVQILQKCGTPVILFNIWSKFDKNAGPIPCDFCQILV